MKFGPVATAYRRASACASSSIPTLMPNDSLPFCEPDRLWKTSPTGAPLVMASIWVDTWARTQFCVGISQRVMTSYVISSSRDTLPTESSDGLIPITLSPDP